MCMRRPAYTNRVYLPRPAKRVLCIYIYIYMYIYINLYISAPPGIHKSGVTCHAWQ